jgi:tol-pal system protein YbgF
MKMLRPLSLVAVLLAAGCVTSSDIEKLQSQISDVQDQIAQLKRTASSKEEVQNVNTRVAEQTQTLLKSNATLVAKVADIEDKMNNAQGGVEQTNYRFDKLAQQLTQAQHDIEELRASNARLAATAAATPAPASATTTTAPATQQPVSEMTVTGSSADAGSNPMEMYQSAYRDYQKGNYDLAISGFREFIDKNPSSEYADNAAYWIAESVYSQKKYAAAVQQFDSVVSKYPKSDKVPGALLKKGLAYIALGDRSRGIVQLQYVVHEHPNSAEAGVARQKLKQFGVETK